MSKTIIFCADGTWNSSEQDENKDGTPDCTNVYKLFLALQGELCTNSLLDEGEQEKTLTNPSGEIRQIAKYIHGVGDSKNPIIKLFGGSTGSGTIARIVRGYTFISRNYTPGDNIIITGFSRGAYTARALGGLISSKGLLKNIHYATKGDRENAYKKSSAVWYEYAKENKETATIEKLISTVSYLPGFISGSSVKKEDLHPVDKISAIAVWDTVGALGIPEIFGDGDKHDAFCFANNILSSKVKNGFHAVSLDEIRAAFIPTLWEKPKDSADQKIEQLLFSGAHSDVGGGYPEYKLSNISLEWMVKKIEKFGILFKTNSFESDIRETAHEPWQEMTFYKTKIQPRDFNGKFIYEHPSIQERADLNSVKSDPKNEPSKYQPQNRL